MGKKKPNLQEKRKPNFISSLPSRFYKLGKQTHNTLIKITNTISKAYGYTLSPVFIKLLDLANIVAFTILSLFVKFFNIISYPFVKMFASVKVVCLALSHSQHKSFTGKLATVGHFTWDGLKNNHFFFKTIVNYSLPVVGVLIFIFTFNFSNAKTYAVNVSYNDASLGYVANEEVVEKAKKIVQSRMVYVNEEAEKIDIKPMYSVNVVEDDVLSEHQLAEAIISLSGDEMIEAEGLYIDDVFYGAVTEQNTIEDTLQFILNSHSSGQEDEEISFINNIQVVSGLYVTNNIVSAESIVNLLTGEVAEEKSYTTAEGETLEDVVQNTQTSLVTIKALNADLADISESKKLAEGTQIVLSVAESFLPVQVTKTITYSETVDYQTIREDSADLSKGYEKITQKGVEGENIITAKVTYLDNVEINREIVSTEVVTEVVDKIISVGTAEISSAGLETSTGQGVSAEGFIWPMSGYVSSEAGARWGTTHKGIDIARYGGATGAPIYAAASGTVVFSGWSSGYGKLVKVDHGDGLVTWYAHNSEIYVSEGQVVSQGTQISAAGSTGNVTGPHLHFEVRVNGIAQNPRLYLP